MVVPAGRATAGGRAYVGSQYPCAGSHHPGPAWLSRTKFRPRLPLSFLAKYAITIFDERHAKGC